GMYLTFALFARKARRWAFITVLVLYGLDSLILVLAMDWLGIIFHALVLYNVVRGIQACGKLKALGAA
ncbi:hypothetical protein Q8G71_34765, partial [Klebsiella pneumoniae]